MQCKMFRSIPGLYLLGTSSSPPSCDSPVCLQTLPNVPWGHSRCQLRRTTLDCEMKDSPVTP